MNDVFLPVFAGFRILLFDPFHCPGTRIFQLVVFGWIGALALRTIDAAILTERFASRLPELGEELAGLQLDGLSAARARGVRVLVADSSGSQLATVGYLKPCLVIAPDLLGSLAPLEAEAVLAHEIEHIRRRDAATAAILSAAASSLALLIPIAAVLYASFPAHLIKLDAPVAAVICLILLLASTSVVFFSEWTLRYGSELRCDQAACRAVGGQAVASALVKVALLARRDAGAVACYGFVRGPRLAVRVARALQYSPPCFCALGPTVCALLCATTVLVGGRELSVFTQVQKGVVIANCAVCQSLAAEQRKLAGRK